MIRTQQLPCNVSRELADSLNRESGRIYTDVLVHHWRALRHCGHWVSNFASQKWGDWRDKDKPSILHSHSIDAAQEAFYKACKTAKTNNSDGAKYPRKRKMFRTTIWKNTGIRKRGSDLLLALARGKEPIKVPLPSQYAGLDKSTFKEMRLVYDIANGAYQWHAVIDDGVKPALPTGNNTAAIDLGEIHPAVATDGTEGMVFSCRELRSVAQGTNKRLASINSKLSKLHRDIVGASNILSKFVHGKLGVVITPVTKYRKPFRRWKLACVVPRTQGKWLGDVYQEATAL